MHMRADVTLHIREDRYQSLPMGTNGDSRLAKVTVNAPPATVIPAHALICTQNIFQGKRLGNGL
jgi:hypothetical protein